MITEINKNLAQLIIKSKTGEEKPEKKCADSWKFKIEDENQELISRAYSYWVDFSKVRADRDRNIRYKNGDQWSDVVEDPDFRGRYVKEESLFERTGRMPLKHNIVAQIIRNLIGQLIANPTQSVVFARNDENVSLSGRLTAALGACHSLNEVDRLNITMLEELLLGGICCTKVRYDFFHDKNRSDGRVDPVNVNNIFFNSELQDPRLNDINLIGEFHDYTIDEIVANFSTSTQEEQKLRNIFSDYQNLDGSSGVIGARNNTPNFYISSLANRHRIYEIWTREGEWVSYLHDPLDATDEPTTLSSRDVEEINNQRIDEIKKYGGSGDEIPLIELTKRYEYHWRVRYISSQGHTLHKSETPYAHQSHPYIIATLPIINGEFHSYISDLIDMQRYINRLIMMIDFIMGSSAKGVLMLPEDCIPDGCSVDDFAQEYVKANGIIVYRPNSKGVVPTQISSNSNPATAWTMLQTQLDLIDKVSGVTEAVQGRTSSSTTTASLYMQQVNNAQLNYKIVFDTINNFIRQRDEKLVKVIMQFYTERRLVDISGDNTAASSFYWEGIDSGEILDFNLVVSQSYDTPTYKLQIEEQLRGMLNNRYIDFNTYLKNSSMPFAKRLLAEMEEQKEHEKSEN